MLFSSLPFLYLFLPLCVLFYFLMPSIRAKNAVLLVFSLVFYAWGEPVYVLLMLGVSAANWAFGLLMERLNKKTVLWNISAVREKDLKNFPEKCSRCWGSIRMIQ